MGMGLSLDTFIEPGIKVRIALSETLITGDICFCRLNEDQSYEAGLLISDVTAMSAGRRAVEELALTEETLPCPE
jgi:hypothetical protein